MTLAPGTLRASHAEIATREGGFDRVVEWRGGWLRVGCEYPATLLVTHDAEGFRVQPSESWIVRRIEAEAALSGLDVDSLRDVCGRIYALLRSMPSNPLDEFRQRTQSMPKSTEVERLAVERVGQDVFRRALDDFWGGRCPVTGISDRELLRASHIRPWSECDDEERLDVFNGVLLAAHVDAAFDKHLLTFSDEGEVIFGSRLSTRAREVIAASVRDRTVAFEAAHRERLAEHRERTLSSEDIHAT